jgi:hypothetical protein
MPTKPEPPNSVIALLADIVRDRSRTRHAALLVFSVGFATTLILASILLIMMLFGTPGTAAVASVLATASLTAASLTARRVVKNRQSRPDNEKDSTNDPPL